MLLLGNGGGRKCIAREGIELNFGGPEEEKGDGRRVMKMRGRGADGAPVMK